MTRTRFGQPKAAHVTFCTFCDREVGVASHRWNNTDRGNGHDLRIARHLAAPGGRQCPGSGITVNPAVVMDGRTVTS